jgi:putative component of membrane protein insertase Oxa1/YidC/SpoIIIJ protein YidD
LIDAPLLISTLQPKRRMLCKLITMQTSTFDTIAKTAALYSIDVYKTHISPKKGFSCPHRLLHGGESCSDYVKRILTEQNLTAAVLSSVQRFKDCNLASQNLQTTAGFRCIIIPCCLPL